MRNAFRSTLAVSAIIVATAALTACSSGPAPADSSSSSSQAAKPTKTTEAAAQSHDAACSIVKTGFTDVASLQGEMSASMGDPKKALALLDEVDTKVGAIDAKVTNDKVKAVTSDAATAIHDYSTYLQQALKDPANVDATQITAKAQELATKFTAVQKECA